MNNLDFYHTLRNFLIKQNYLCCWVRWKVFWTTLGLQQTRVDDRNVSRSHQPYCVFQVDLENSGVRQLRTAVQLPHLSPIVGHLHQERCVVSFESEDGVQSTSVSVHCQCVDLVQVVDCLTLDWFAIQTYCIKRIKWVFSEHYPPV